LLKGRGFHAYEQCECVTGALAQDLIGFRGGWGDVELREELFLQMFVGIQLGSRRGLGSNGHGKAAGSACEQDAQP
jgi:hypothetical protein